MCSMQSLGRERGCCRAKHSLPKERSGKPGCTGTGTSQPTLHNVLQQGDSRMRVGVLQVLMFQEARDGLTQQVLL